MLNSIVDTDAMNMMLYARPCSVPDPVFAQRNVAHAATKISTSMPAPAT